MRLDIAYGAHTSHSPEEKKKQNKTPWHEHPKQRERKKLLQAIFKVGHQVQERQSMAEANLSTSPEDSPITVPKVQLWVTVATAAQSWSLQQAL